MKMSIKERYFEVVDGQVLLQFQLLLLSLVLYPRPNQISHTTRAH